MFSAKPRGKCRGGGDEQATLFAANFIYGPAVCRLLCHAWSLCSLLIARNRLAVLPFPRTISERGKIERRPFSFLFVFLQLSPGVVSIELPLFRCSEGLDTLRSPVTGGGPFSRLHLLRVSPSPISTRCFPTSIHFEARWWRSNVTAADVRICFPHSCRTLCLLLTRYHSATFQDNLVPLERCMIALAFFPYFVFDSMYSVRSIRRPTQCVVSLERCDRNISYA